MTKPLRCAVYTRKSTDEGLDQEFNSLDAQREACEAYVQSQASQGWKVLTTKYDDGGYSGGTLQRPALTRLLQDVERGVIDVIVVYKIDRLSRSLTDFARLVECLDRHDVTFVSVTQQFNTTTSMGRLTLNVLLSFAQFEREVTGERIRDKIAASKKKGMWMGGAVPLGYDVRDRKLMINHEEAERVRLVYRLYLELGSVRALAAELKRRGVRSKVRVSASGVRSGGQHFGTGALYLILQNRLYRGEIAYKDTVYSGQHEAIVDCSLWERVQEQVAENRRKHRGSRNANTVYLLAGLLFDDRGHAMSPHHAQKSGGRRYGYYVSQAKLYQKGEEAGTVARVAAGEIEAVVEEVALKLLTPLQKTEWHTSSTVARRELLGTVVERIELRPNALLITLPPNGDESEPAENSPDRMLTVPFVVRSRGVEKQIHVTGNGRPLTKPDPTLVAAIVRSYRWRSWIERGKVKSLEGIAEAEGCTEAYVRKLLPVAFLAPDIIEAIVAGNQPRNVTLADFTSKPLPLDWQAQRERLSFSRGS